MQKTLEPKEQQIEQLKDEIFKLEAQFEELIKKSKNDQLSM